MKFLLRLLIRFYQILLRPILKAVGGPYSGCRFSPSCSHYFLEALELHGAIKGSYLGVRRILRCHPWGGFGYDPVPREQDAPCSCAQHSSTPPTH